MTKIDAPEDTLVRLEHHLWWMCQSKAAFSLVELTVPTVLSLPYAWDGQRFRFVTDILGAASFRSSAGSRPLHRRGPEIPCLGSDLTFHLKWGL